MFSVVERGIAHFNPVRKVRRESWQAGIFILGSRITNKLVAFNIQTTMPTL